MTSARFRFLERASGQSSVGFSKDAGNDSPSPRGRVALLGIAQRSIRIKYAQRLRKDPRVKLLPVSVKTVGDWIQVNRMAKNLTRCHLALKMGIATAWVQSWEDGTVSPNDQQLKFLANLFGIAPPKEGA